MLIHYTIVRRDLPLGVVCAMLVHAAGESAAIFDSEQIEGFSGCTAVVLEAKSEHILLQYVEYLNANNIKHILVHESSAPYAGQLMAIGLIPAEREDLAQKMSFFQTLKKLDVVAGE